MSDTFDSIVIGAGQAGPALAARLAASGEQVALIERDQMGGTCVNTGCMPTKTLVASAHAAWLAREGERFGIMTGPVTVDVARVRARAKMPWCWLRVAMSPVGWRTPQESP